MIKRVVLLAMLVITGLALETSVFGELTLTGTKSELMVLITVGVALTQGPSTGAMAGFVAGLASDLILGLPRGVGALTLTLTGYVVGRMRVLFQTPTAWMPIAMVTAATFFAVLFYGGFSILLGQTSLPMVRILRHAALASVYNALLTPFLYPVLRTVGGKLGPRSEEVLPS
ncbi:MAG TPA: rod shape-determining protein MreD [Actinomycetota bacterium]